jgi:hypothetical protein
LGEIGFHFRGDQGEIKGKIDISYYKMKIKNKDNYLIQTNKYKRLRGPRSGLWKANKRSKYKDGRVVDGSLGRLRVD